MNKLSQYTKQTKQTKKWLRNNEATEIKETAGSGVSVSEATTECED